MSASTQHLLEIWKKHPAYVDYDMGSHRVWLSGLLKALLAAELELEQLSAASAITIKWEPAKPQVQPNPAMVTAGGEFVPPTPDPLTEARRQAAAFKPRRGRKPKNPPQEPLTP